MNARQVGVLEGQAQSLDEIATLKEEIVRLYMTLEEEKRKKKAFYERQLAAEFQLSEPCIWFRIKACLQQSFNEEKEEMKEEMKMEEKKEEIKEEIKEEMKMEEKKEDKKEDIKEEIKEEMKMEEKEAITFKAISTFSFPIKQYRRWTWVWKRLRGEYPSLVLPSLPSKVRNMHLIRMTN